jgi:ubiquitin carboxyl-terminal hydrolase 4/11/15
MAGPNSKGGRNPKKKKKKKTSPSNRLVDGDSSVPQNAVTVNSTIPTNTITTNGTSEAATDWYHAALACKEQGNAVLASTTPLHLDPTTTNHTNPIQQAVADYQRGLACLSAVADTPAAATECWRDLRTQLHGNLAIAWAKLGDYEAVEAACSLVLDSPTSAADVATAKLWYRRGTARYERGRHGPDEALLHASHDDLRHAQILLEQIDNNASKSHHHNSSNNTMQQSVQSAMQKTTRALEECARMCNRSSNYSSNGTSEATVDISMSLANVTAVRPERPDPLTQRDDVRKLLLARHCGFAQQQQPPSYGNGHGHCASETVESTAGEALFLIDWDWWCDWCYHVGFYATNAPQIQYYMVQGAVLPDEEEDRDMDQSDAPPGPIDNTALFLLAPQVWHAKKTLSTAQHFYKTWYLSYTTTHGHTTTVGDIVPPLQPHLVRGYHYELLPREVYAALRLWYGELTPSICRRVSVSRHVPTVHLHPQSPTLQPATGPTSSFCSACYRAGATMRCKRCMSVYYCQRSCQESHWQFHKAPCKRLAATNTEETVGSPVLPPPSYGRVGLHNLGNTCFMNSALQCLSHATPLTRSFLSNLYLIDVNVDNPLGSGGNLAHAYGAVLKDLWMKSNTTSLSPTALKRAIAMFAPRFAGCLQHDAQEFLAYLLDGLHEDLNRVRQKPYVEMPDITQGQNMAVAGARAWEALRRRDDSLVMDTFYGQFRSTCVCPRCQRVSVSFDAFNHVSLQIPTSVNATISVGVFVMGESGRWTRYGVSLPRTATTATLRLHLTELCGGKDLARLVLLEVFHNAIVRVVDETKSVGQLHPNTVLAAFDVDPLTGNADPTFHVCASHKLLPEDGDNNLDQPELFGFPFMISFSGKTTCRQAWEHLWSKVQHLVAHGSDEPDSSARDLLQIHLHDHRNQRLPVFPVANLDVTLAEMDNAMDTECTSALPRDSDLRLIDLLGPKSTDNYIFFWLEWQESPDVVLGSVPGEKGLESRIDEERFLAFESDASWLLCQKRQRAQSLAKGVTLDECFETFIQPERLDDSNMWYCSNCKDHVRAMKTMELWRLPNVLVVHLKRFEFRNVLRRDKLETLVDFPLDGLDMSKHCGSYSSRSFEDEHVPATYDLFAVTNHFGRMGFGHYTAFARRWDEEGIHNEHWALFDDSSVQEVTDERNIVSSAAYVLFYRRRTFH